jgi:hypothetical protein
MKEIKAARFGSYPIDAHCDFLTDVITELENATTAVITALEDLPAELNSKLIEEKAIEAWQKRSLITDEIEEDDRLMDLALTALRALVKAQTYNVNKPNAEAADRVYTMLMKYGDVNRKPYSAQSGDIRSILRELAGKFSGDVTWLMQYAPTTTALITNLKNAHTVFKAALKKRDAYYNEKPDKTFKEIRKEIEPIYHEIAKIINFGASANKDAGFLNLINIFNPEIERLNTAFHRVRHSISAAQPAPIPEQHFTGLPVTPTPEVLLPTEEKTVRLVLGKDYNLKYKDNIKVGNAFITIQGRGSYKGQKTTSFIIKRP